MQQIYDTHCNRAIRKNKNMLVPWYLMASWAYYVDDNPILSDTLYDSMCVDILTLWHRIEHRHKDLLDIEALKAGTGFQIVNYPNIVIGAVRHIRTQKGHTVK